MREGGAGKRSWVWEQTGVCHANSGGKGHFRKIIGLECRSDREAEKVIYSLKLIISQFSWPQNSDAK